MAVLIQQHLVYWFSSSEDHATVYEANLANAYALVRSGKYIKVVEDRYGDVAGGVISNLLLLGHVRVGDLTQAYVPSKDSKGHLNGSYTFPDSALSNGSTTKQVESLNGHGPTADSLHQTLYDLLQAGLVSAVNESHFRSLVDNRTEAEKEVPFQDRYAGKLKKEHEAEREQAVLNKLDDWKYGTKQEREQLAALRKGRKRPFGNHEDAPGAKRQRLDQADQFRRQQLAGTGYLDVRIAPKRVHLHLAPAH